MSRMSGIDLDPWEVQLRKGSLDLAVMASLWGGRAYGLEILRAMKNDASLAVPEGTIYPLLSRLKAEGLLTSEWQETEGGHPRKYYTLTEKGRRRVAEMKRIWCLFSHSLERLLTSVPGPGER